MTRTVEAQYDNTGRNLVLMEETLALLARTRQAGLFPLVVKGAWRLLSGTAAWEERRLSDVDLLIRPAEEKKFTALLLANGYRLLPSRGLLFGRPSGSGAVLDVATGIWYQDREKDFLALWDTRETCCCQGQEVAGLSREEHFIYSGVHAVVHHGCRDERWMFELKYDLAALGQKKAVVDRIACYGMSIPFDFIFAHLEKQGAPLAAWYRAALERTAQGCRGSRGRFPWWQKKSYGEIFRPGRPPGVSYAGEARQYIFHGPTGKAARALWGLVFPSRRELQRKYQGEEAGRGWPRLYAWRLGRLVQAAWSSFQRERKIKNHSPAEKNPDINPLIG